MKVAVVHNVPIAGRPDSMDVLDQARLVVAALRGLGIEHRVYPLGAPYAEGPEVMEAAIEPSRLASPGSAEFALLRSLKKYAPRVVFNLVEDERQYQIYQQHYALLFERFNYDFTGAGYEAIMTTTDKVLSKSIMRAFGVPTPESQVYRGQREPITVPGPWIVKPALEDASIGIDDASVFHDERKLVASLHGIFESHGRQQVLIEHYLEGREFNVSVIEDGSSVHVLPVAEMTFVDWPEGKPRIVGYTAKWEGQSFESNNTRRRFDPEGVPLEAIREVALRCWNVFNLSGYARVDMRMDEAGKLYVLEANANPCIAPDSGLIAALKESGRTEQEFIKSLIEAAIKSSG